MLRWPLGRKKMGAARTVDRARMALPTAVRGLELRARRLMNSRAIGAYDSVFRGQGIEFADVREYQPGDPFQAIDWKVTARMGRPFVKSFVEERELSVLLCVDLSASTGFGTRGRQKRELATEVAAVLALAGNRSRDRVGLLLFTDRVERYVRPVRGRNRLRRLLCEMVEFQPAGRGTAISEALESAARLLKVRSLVFVLSDFQGAEYERALAAASRRHDVVGIDIRDPAELELPAAGWLEVVDPETGDTATLDLADGNTRAAVARWAEAEEARTAEIFRRHGCDRICLRTDLPYAAALSSFFTSRMRRRAR